jgi:hypothetical protein
VDAYQWATWREAKVFLQGVESQSHATRVKELLGSQNDREFLRPTLEMGIEWLLR